VELVLPGYDSHSSIPIGTLGDLSTGAQHPTSQPFARLKGSPTALEWADPGDDLPSGTASRATQRPDHIHLPLRRSISIPVTTSNHPLSPSPSDGTSYSYSGASNSILPAQRYTGLKVLVVDDDPLTRTLMERMLTRMGCRVTTAENGEVALELILADSRLTPSSFGSGPILEQPHLPSSPNDEKSRGRYAVVFLDNQMPVMSGLTTVARLRELGRQDFVVGVTGERFLVNNSSFDHFESI
jgi:osomolarity two-component system sensor histidine kinase SLN1